MNLHRQVNTDRITDEELTKFLLNRWGYEETSIIKYTINKDGLIVYQSTGYPVTSSRAMTFMYLEMIRKARRQ